MKRGREVPVRTDMLQAQVCDEINVHLTGKLETSQIGEHSIVAEQRGT